ncbi:MAG: low molecular weight phosphatase family protein, partial [Proteobacteria bacterium]|nr:low molecular weight phosphatase family protein [Pseudomonadota bacterium]
MSDLPDAVLFACTRNSVRSPMAEGLLKHLLGHRIYVDSAGVRASAIDPFVIEVMEEIGIDMSNHRGKSFENLEDTS